MTAAADAVVPDLSWLAGWWIDDWEDWGHETERRMRMVTVAEFDDIGSLCDESLMRIAYAAVGGRALRIAVWHLATHRAETAAAA